MLSPLKKGLRRSGRRELNLAPDRDVVNIKQTGINLRLGMGPKVGFGQNQIREVNHRIRGNEKIGGTRKIVNSAIR